MENRYDYGIGYYKENNFTVNEWKIDMIMEQDIINIMTFL